MCSPTSDEDTTAASGTQGKAADEEPVKSDAPSSTLIYHRMNFVNMLCYVRWNLPCSIIVSFICYVRL